MPSLPDLRIQQAILAASPRGVRAVAQTEGFDTPEGERIAVLFGSRPAGVACPLAHFAVPFGKSGVAVVTVADQVSGDLGFRFLVLSRDLYRHLGDPFAIADRYPVDWTTNGALPLLSWPPQPLPRRMVDDLQQILKAGDGPLLLGSAQSLVDGGPVLVKRVGPDEVFLRNLWQLLPDRVRCDLWPASFAFSNDLGFHAAAMPMLLSDPSGVRRSEEGLRDYPQSRYELHLQIAVEDGNQAALDALFARRSSSETLRLGLYIIAFALIVAMVMKFLL